MIRELIRSWDTTKTVRQAILDKGSKYPENLPLLQELSSIITEYNLPLADKQVRGDITNSLSMSEIDKLPVTMTVVFSQLCEESGYKFDVIDYLIYMLYECKRKNLDRDLINTVVCRSLRSLPSYLRELDLKKMLSRELGGVEIQQSADIDLKQHADAHFVYNGVNYYIWSYTNTRRARDKAVEKFGGERGELPKGVHILFPFSLWHCDDINGWKLYRDSDVNLLVSKVKSGDIDCDYETFCASMREDDFGKMLIVGKG